MALEERLKQRAQDLGFDVVGIAPAAPADGFDRLRAWLAQGFAGEMKYLERGAEARRHPASILPQVRSVVMAGMNYFVKEFACERVGECEGSEGTAKQTRSASSSAPTLPPSHSPTSSASHPTAISPPHRLTGQVARYARGSDYHDILRRRLQQLLDWLQAAVPSCCGRAVVDTAPLLERDFARRAGLGWFGKNTMLLNKRLGSYFFLGALLLDLDLQPDPVQRASHCGTCTACLEACPTQAFPAPGQLDSRRCISYLTIELRGSIPENLRHRLDDRVFGCDICQEVCPWNRKAPPAVEPEFQPRPDLHPLALPELLGLTEEAFRRRFRGTALMRAKRRGLLRNAAIVLGNRGGPAALPALRQALADPEPLVREAAQWAIEQIAQKSMRQETLG